MLLFNSVYPITDNCRNRMYVCGVLTMTGHDTRHQCRWCTSLCTGNGIWCSEKKKCLSESYTKRVNKCKDFQFVNMDAYTLEEYKQRVRHNNQCEGQVSFF